MTYRELKNLLENIGDESLDQNVTVYDSYEDEYFPTTDTGFCYDGVLDDGHLFLIIKAQ